MTPEQMRMALEAIEAEENRRDMHSFMKNVAWPVVEQGTKFKDNWHIHAICEHLQAVLDNQIRNLVINMPPRFMKSLLISVGFPAYAWVQDNINGGPGAALRFIYASYSKDLSTRDAVKTRRVIESPYYQRHYGDMFAMSGDQNVKTKYENDKTGHRLSTSVGGLGTGEGGDIIVADDPHNVLDAESDPVRQEVLVWWDETMSTRINDPLTGHKIIVMQRVHESDLSGHVLEKGGYEHLMIPMRWEEERAFVTVLGKMDPRTTEGELAWTERYNEEAVQLLETALGPYGVAGQFQQTPSPRGGAMFDTSKIKIIDAAPAGVRWVRGWDLAATEEKVGVAPAYTAGGLLGRVGTGAHTRWIIGDMVADRWDALGVETAIQNTASLDGKDVQISLPQDPGQAGKAQATNFVAMLSGYNVHTSPESGSKMTRAEPLSAQVQAGNVSMIRGSWNKATLDEMKTFPAGKFKDRVDALSRAFALLVELPSGAANILEWARQEAERIRKMQESQQNPQVSRENMPSTQLFGA